MPFDVFISYSSEDKTTADATCAFLESEKIRCWIAPRDAEYGSNYSASIVRAIKATRVMILIFSRNANASEHIIREVGLAAEARSIIIPLRTEDTELNDDLKYFLGLPHWLDALSPPLEKYLEILVRRLKGILATPMPETRTQDESINLNPTTADNQLRLARRYEKGDGVPLDEDLARKWYEAAAESGSAEANMWMGRYWAGSPGVSGWDDSEAFRYYGEALKLGHKDAARCLEDLNAAIKEVHAERAKMPPREMTYDELGSLSEMFSRHLFPGKTEREKIDPS